MQRLVETSQKAFGYQLATFLSVALNQLLIALAKRHYKASRPNGLKDEDEKCLQELFEAIPDLEEVLERIDA